MRKITISLFLLLFLILLSPISLAQVPSSINYQGVLKYSSGELVSGEVNMTFQIYDGPDAGATSLWDETKLVTLEAGLYSVLLGSQTDPITPEVFSGVPRYLGVTIVGESEMKPRIQLVTVPYAFVSEVASRSAVTDSLSDAALQYVNTRTVTVPDPLAPADTIQDIEGDLIVWGAEGTIWGNAIWGITRKTGLLNWGIAGTASGEAKGVFGVNTALANGGPGVKGESTSGIGVHGETGATSALVPAVYGYNISNGYGVYGRSDLGTGVRGIGKIRGVDGGSQTGVGVFGISEATGEAGVKGESDNGIGVYGKGRTGVIGFSRNYNLNYSGTYGVLGGFRLFSGVIPLTERAAGVVGKSKEGHGVHGISEASNKAGVYAQNSAGPALQVEGGPIIGSGGVPHTPVEGSFATDAMTLGTTKSGWDVFINDDLYVRDRVYSEGRIKANDGGIYGRDSGSGVGVEGESDSGPGVRGQSTSGHGVVGLGKGATEPLTATLRYGGLFVSTDGAGVRGQSSTGHGVVGLSNVDMPSGIVYKYGGFFRSAGDRALGVYGDAYILDDVHADNYLAYQSLDIAEWVKVNDTSIEEGDVVVLDKNSKKSFAKSSAEYSTIVAGIVSTDPAFLAGVHGDIEESLSKEQMEAKGYRMLALAGQVPCNVSTENGPIEIGDLLTTSNTPGYAMKVTDKLAAVGAFVGKAMEPLASGRGKIMVLVTLQ